MPIISLFFSLDYEILIKKSGDAFQKDRRPREVGSEVVFSI